MTEYVNVYLPDRFLADCVKTMWQPGGTFRQVSLLAKAREGDLDTCTARMQEARKYQDKLRAQEAAEKGVSH